MSEFVVEMEDAPDNHLESFNSAFQSLYDSVLELASLNSTVVARGVEIPEHPQFSDIHGLLKDGHLAIRLLSKSVQENTRELRRALVYG